MSLLLLDGKKQLEFGRQLLFAIQSVRKVDSSNTTVRVDRDS